MWVVVGLGNPGRRYRATRHNAGFVVIDRLAARWHVTVAREAHGARIGEARRDQDRVLLVKPQTYMNASGDAVASLQRFYRLSSDNLVIVHDDVDLPLGRVRIRRGGRAGGNRGVASVIERLGDAEFLRVKIGVGRPPTGRVTADHVLAPLAPDEGAAFDAACDVAADAVELVLTQGAETAMNRVNGKTETPRP